MALTGDHLAGDIGHIEDHNTIDSDLADHGTSITRLTSANSKDYTVRSRVTTWTHDSSGSWLDVPFDSEYTHVQDDGTDPMYVNPNFYAPVTGLYVLTATVKMGSGAGTWYVQWQSAGSILFRETAVASEIVNCTGVLYVAAGGFFDLQIYQSSGTSQTLAAHSAASPFRAIITRVA